MIRPNLSFHDKDGCLRFNRHHLETMSLLSEPSSVFLGVPKRLPEGLQSLILREASLLPDPLMESVDILSVDLNAVEQGLPIDNPTLSAFLADCNSYWLAYHKGYLRITKLPDLGQGQCVKQNVVATLVTPDNEVFVGTNRCHSPQTDCPRELQGMKSGEGYHLCNTVCQQEAHAEVDAINQAGDKARGGELYLIGHHYACNNCQQVANKNNVTIHIANRLV